MLVPFLKATHPCSLQQCAVGTHFAGLRAALCPPRRLSQGSQAHMTARAATSTVRAPADGDFYKYGLKPVIGEGLMDATLKRLGAVEIKPMQQSTFVKPQSVMYELDGK